MRDAKGLSRQAIEEISCDGFARRKADGMDQSIKAIPVLAKLRENGFDLCVIGHVARQHDIAAELGREFTYAVLETITDVGECELCALLVTGTCNPIR